jgi:TRAP-type C4-dicarboxylate transport system permease small subunit
MAALVRRSGAAATFVVRWTLALCIFFIMALTTVDVFARYVFSAPLKGAYEIVSMLMALAIFLALPLVARHNEHIGVDLIQGKLGARAERIHWPVVRLVEAVVIAAIAARLWTLATLMLEAGQVTGFLEWPLAPLAFVLSALAAVTALITVAEAFQPPRRVPAATHAGREG